MGNASSRHRRNESSESTPQQSQPIPPGPVSDASLPPHNSTPVRRHCYPGRRNERPSLPPPAPSNSHWEHSSLTPPSSEPPSPGQQLTITVRNTVNVQKNTISLFEDAENAGFYLLAFFYDADSAGSYEIFYFAIEDSTDGSITPWNSNAYSPARLPFGKGAGKKFEQASGTGIYLNAFDPCLLEKEHSREGCPLVIRAQINLNDTQSDSRSMTEEIGASLSKSVNSQITQAVIEKKGDGDFKVRVLRQIIWVDGVRYELKELYGIHNALSKNDIDEEDFGKECVICMSEPRDTAVMPCRHMCMCNGCASTFKAQMNRCPICRQPLETLMKIRI